MDTPQPHPDQTRAPSPAEEETEFDTFTRRCGTILTGAGSAPWVVEVVFQDCVDKFCRKCYEPLYVSISSEDTCGPSELQLDIADSWEPLNQLVAALAEARRRPGC
jgi:hypothetical protein